MKKLETYAYALLRIASGFMFTFHGVQKILGVLTDHRPPVGSQLWIGGLIELFGGIMITLGLGTRIAAFLASGMMAVAYFQVHWQLRWGADALPGVNKGELAVLYCFVFLLLACGGDGRWSLGKK